MSSNGGGRPRRDRVSERVQADEPLIDPVVLDALEEADLPLRGEFRKNVLKKISAQVRQRRTVDGVAARLSSNIVSPISTAMEQELDSRVRKRITERAKEMTEDRGGQ